jgi:hypothetical protein
MGAFARRRFIPSPRLRSHAANIKMISCDPLGVPLSAIGTFAMFFGRTFLGRLDRRLGEGFQSLLERERQVLGCLELFPQFFAERLDY